MAAKPTNRASWATNAVQEVRVIDDAPVILENKVEPSQEYKDSGELYRQNLPRAYLNYQLDLVDEWLNHLDERYAVGDFHLGASADTASAVSIRLGGTWLDRGTDTIAAQTVRLFEKTV